MPTVSRPNTYVNGGTTTASEANDNETTLYNLVNGTLDYTNLSPTANIQNSQLASGGGFVNPMDAVGEIIYGGASGVATALTAGDEGDILTAHGAAAPTWEAPAVVPSGFTTGDVKLTFKTSADATWVMMNDGTIGNAASGGTTRANADTSALFTLLWTNTADADCAVSSGRGATAAADYAANKTIALPKVLGRAMAGAGAGAGLTSRALAKAGIGVETHALSVAELATHYHSYNAPTGAGSPTGTGSGTLNPAATNTGNQGSGTAHQNMQPSAFLNVMIKL
jgi:microcystin-dependent protein